MGQFEKRFMVDNFGLVPFTDDEKKVRLYLQKYWKDQDPGG